MFSARRFVAPADGLSVESLAMAFGFAERLRAVERVGVDPLTE